MALSEALSYVALVPAAVDLADSLVHSTLIQKGGPVQRELPARLDSNLFAAGKRIEVDWNVGFGPDRNGANEHEARNLLSICCQTGGY